MPRISFPSLFCSGNSAHLLGPNLVLPPWQYFLCPIFYSQRISTFLLAFSLVPFTQTSFLCFSLLLCICFFPLDCEFTEVRAYIFLGPHVLLTDRILYTKTFVTYLFLIKLSLLFLPPLS